MKGSTQSLYAAQLLRASFLPLILWKFSVVMVTGTTLNTRKRTVIQFIFYTNLTVPSYLLNESHSISSEKGK